MNWTGFNHLVRDVDLRFGKNQLGDNVHVTLPHGIINCCPSFIVFGVDKLLACN
jgi:hypothetical protein